MSCDPTILFDALTGLAGVLEAAAAEIPWEPTVCVTPVEPGVDCETIHVWPGAINTNHGPTNTDCVTEPNVTLNWRLSTCIGADPKETCEWWTENDRTETALSRLWGIYGGLILSFYDTTATGLAEMLGVSSCKLIRFGPVLNVQSGDMAVWQGSLIVKLDVERIAS